MSRRLSWRTSCNLALLVYPRCLPEVERKRQLAVFYAQLFMPVAGIAVLSYGAKAAHWRAEQDAKLRHSGLPRPLHEAQIAAVAASQNLTLITRNLRDFEPYEGLRLENWFEVN